MHHFLKDQRVVNVLSFGQLPNKVIYREIEELRGINLSDYIQSHMQAQEALEFDAKLAEASRNKYVIKEESQESRENPAEPTSPPTLESPSAPVPNGFGARARKTLFTEFETIEIAIQIINLLEVLHQKNIIHTNLNPENIFLVDNQITKMCFTNLYHCSW